MTGEVAAPGGFHGGGVSGNSGNSGKSGKSFDVGGTVPGKSGKSFDVRGGSPTPPLGGVPRKIR